jgi:hypothetical protein
MERDVGQLPAVLGCDRLLSVAKSGENSEVVKVPDKVLAPVANPNDGNILP